jgi:hypothetical protein
MSDIVDLPGLGQVHKSAISHCGSLLAASSHEGSPLDDGPVVVTLYDMKTMSRVQRVSICDCRPGVNEYFVFSPAGTTLVFVDGRHEIMVFEVHDLNIRRQLRRQYGNELMYASAIITFDPSS